MKEKNKVKILATIITAAVSLIVGFVGGKSVVNSAINNQITGNVSTITIQEGESTAELINQLIQENKDLDAENDDLKKDNDDLKKENDDLKKENEDLITENKILKENENENPTDTISTPDTSDNFNSDTLIGILEQYKVTGSGGVKFYKNGQMVSVFAEDITNALSFDMAVCYNAWGNEQQYSVFNASQLTMNTMYCSVGGMTGGEGNITIQIYLNGNKETGVLDSTLDIDMASSPERIPINLNGASSFAIYVCNNADVENTIVFYDFSDKE